MSSVLTSTGFTFHPAAVMEAPFTQLITFKAVGEVRVRVLLMLILCDLCVKGAVEVYCWVCQYMVTSLSGVVTGAAERTSDHALQ